MSIRAPTRLIWPIRLQHLPNLRRFVAQIVSRVLLSLSLALVIAASATGEPARAQTSLVPSLQRSALLERFFVPDDKPLVQYRALRRLTASTRGGRLTATLDVWTTLDPVHGFTFDVVSEEGSPLIRRRVLMAALEAEQRSQTARDREEAALTTNNYEFLDVNAVPPHFVRIDLQPKRKHVMRVNGSLFLEEESADLVRIEGELSKRPSIWTRRVQILREYGRIDGVRVPLVMRSTADVLVVGVSRFSMTYTYVEINGQPVLR
jgi:hypothetical protein